MVEKSWRAFLPSACMRDAFWTARTIPFWRDFYREDPGSAFRTQMYFLNERYQRLRDALAAEAPGALVADFLFEKDKIFAYLNLDNEELKLYERYFERFAAELAPPDLVIYLQASPEVLRERIEKKGAPGESRISQEYIEEVSHAYEHFFFRYSASEPARGEHLGNRLRQSQRRPAATAATDRGAREGHAILPSARRRLSCSITTRPTILLDARFVLLLGYSSE